MKTILSPSGITEPRRLTRLTRRLVDHDPGRRVWRRIKAEWIWEYRRRLRKSPDATGAAYYHAKLIALGESRRGLIKFDNNTARKLAEKSANSRTLLRPSYHRILGYVTVALIANGFFGLALHWYP